MPTGDDPDRKKTEEPENVRDVVKGVLDRRVGRIWRIALLGLAAAAGAIVWNWETIREHPFLKSPIDRVTRLPIPKADPRRFSVAVARLDNDPGREHEKLIIALLFQTPGIQVLRIDRPVGAGRDPIPEKDVRRGHAEARTYLEKSGASVLLWGSVLSLGSDRKPALYLTTTGSFARNFGQYMPETAGEFRLPEALWSDLSTVLQLVIATQASRFYAAIGRPVASELEPFVARVRNLVNSPGRLQGNDEAQTWTRVILADGLWRLATETNNRQALEEAISHFEVALRHVSPSDDARNWAAIQRSLQGARAELGEMGGDGRYRESLEVLERVLDIYRREKDLEGWASTQHLIANAWLSIGERTESANGTPELDKAIARLDLALKVFGERRHPQAWASSKNDLGVAYRARSQANEDEKKKLEDLDRAAASYRDALRVHREDSLPQYWAATTTNLGISLLEAGDLIADQDRKAAEGRIVEAIRAFNRTRRFTGPSTYPHYWGEATNSLANALVSLGELNCDAGLFEQAARMYADVQQVWNRRSQSRLWTMAEHNRADALRALGTLNRDREKLLQAEAAFRQVKAEHLAADDALRASRAENGLAQVRAALDGRVSYNCRKAA